MVNLRTINRLNKQIATILLVSILLVSSNPFLNISSTESKRSIENHRNLSSIGGRPISSALPDHNDVKSSHVPYRVAGSDSRLGAEVVTSPTIEMFSSTSSGKLVFAQNETATDDGTLTGKSNNFEFTVTPATTEYDSVAIDVDVYTTGSSYTVEDQNTLALSHAVTYQSIYAQGYALKNLKNNASVFVESVFLDNPIGGSNVNVTLSIYNATQRISDMAVIPDVSLGSTSLINNDTDNMQFIFQSPIEVKSTETYVNGTGGYVFFVLQRDDTDGSATMALGFKDDDTGEPNDGPTYYYFNSSGAASPPTGSDWGSETIYDVTINFNATFEFDASQLEGVVKTPESSTGLPMTAGGRFTDNIQRTSATNYIVSYNTSMISPEVGYINVTYVQTDTTRGLAGLDFRITPNATIAYWNTSYTSSFGVSTANKFKYFSIPKYFTVTSIVHEGTPLNSPTDYRVVTGPVNKTVYLDPGAGTFVMNMTSPNALQSASVGTFVNNSGWMSSTSGFMGTVREPDGTSNVTVGEQVNATVLNTPSLNLVGGTLNASLRATNGSILPLRDIGGYTDTSSNTEEYPFSSNSISFSTYLDPDMPIGTYTFQFIWYNGSAVGALSVEFGVKPVVDFTLLTPNPSITVLEGTEIAVDMILLDRSHPDGNWTSAVNSLTWDMDTYAITSMGLYSDGYSYLYSTNISTSKVTYPSLRPNNYTVTIEFSEEQYTLTQLIDLEVFYRGGSSISAPSNVEATNPFDILFTPLNLTDGAVLKTTDIKISVNSSYTLSYNNVTGEWTITVLWDDFPRGENVFQVNWTQSDIRRSADRSFQLENITVNFVDTALPVVNSPSDFSYNETTTSNIIPWTVSDTYPKNMTIFDGSGNPVPGYDSIPWTSGDINFPVDGLLRGSYNYTIMLEDESGNKVTDSVTVTVFDGVKPAVGSPSDFSYNESSTGNTITWNVNDLHPDNYTVYLNGTPYSSYDNIAWTSGSLVVNIDGISKGTYNFTILVQDESGNQRSDTVIVTIFDGTVPVIDHPSDISYNETSTGNTITWNIVDTNSRNYTVYLDGAPYVGYDNQTWSSGALIVDIDGLLKGTYNFTLVIQDESDFTNSDTVIVTVYDGTFPATTSPEDITYSEGNVGNNITWVVTDAYARNYTIYQNGTPVQGHIDRTWSNGDLILDIDGLARGVYNFTLVLQDESGLTTIDTVILTVLDTTPPAFSTTPQNMTFAEGDSVPDLQWIVSDVHPGNYSISVNTSVVQTGMWVDLITYSIVNLPEGSYTIVLTVLDESGNQNVSVVYVTVLDTTAPVIDNPSDVQFELGTTGNTVVWTGTDNHPENYSIYVDDILVESGTWSSTVEFTVDMQLGVYNVTIVLFDRAGNSVSDTVFVTVADTIAPQVTPVPSELNVIHESNTYLNFTATDLDPGTYTIYQNGTVVDSGDWISGEKISLSLSDLELGTYNISMVFTDGSGNASPTVTVIVTVRDPEIIYTVVPEIPLTATVKGGDLDEFTVTWRTENDTVVTGATLEAVLTANGTQYVKLTFTADTNGEFLVLLNYTGVPVGVFMWTFNFTKAGYESQVFSHKVTVEKHIVDLSVQLPPDLAQGENYTIVVHVSYADNQAGLSLTGVTSLQGGVPGVNLSVVISYIANDGSVTTLIKTGTTDDAGNAIIVLTGEETLLIQELTGITATLLSEEFVLPDSFEVPATELSTVVQKENDIIDWFVFILEVISENIQLFIGIVTFIAAAIVLLILTRRRAKKRAVVIALNTKTAVDEIRGLNSISTIFIRSTTGLPFFEESYKVTDVDIALVAGISTAVNSILSELKEDEMGFETMVRSGLSITSHKLQHSTMVLISSEALPQVILDQVEAAHKAVEREYGSDINDSTIINTIEMQEVAEILEENGLKLSLKRPLQINLSTVSSLRSKSSINRLVRSNLDHVAEFYLATEEAEVPVTLASLIDYIDTKVDDRDLVYRIIATLVTHGALTGNSSMGVGV